MTSNKMTARDIITMSLLILMSVFLFADQRIMSAILPELSKEYGIDDKMLGFIGSAFTLIGAFVSIFFGFFTDKISRKKLLIFVVIIGELPCLLTGFEYFTPNVESFILLRILTGIGIGGIYPISFSLISDYFKEDHRALASALLGVSWIIGMMVGPALAGYLTNEHGWRIAFILAAAPNFPIVLIFALYAKEPERGRTENALKDLIEKGMAYKQRISLSDFKYIFSNKTNLFTFMQGIPGTIPWGILGYWMIHFLQNTRGFSKENATTAFLVLGLGSIVGSVLFAVIGEKMYKKNPASLPVLCGAGVLVGLVPALVFTNMKFMNPQGTELVIFYLLAFVTGVLVSVPSANVKAILMNVNPPEHRGSVFAVFNITDNIGQGFGPAIGGLLVSTGYLFMMNFAILWWIPCGLLFFFIAAKIKGDRDALHKLLEERAKEMVRNNN